MDTKFLATKKTFKNFMLATLLVAFSVAFLSIFLCTQQAHASQAYYGYSYRYGYFEFNTLFNSFDELRLDQNNSTTVKQDTVYNFGTGKSYNSTISNLKMTATTDNKLILEYKINTPWYTFFNGGTDIYPDIFVNYKGKFDSDWHEAKLQVKHWNDNCDFASNKHVMIDFAKDEPCLLDDMPSSLISKIQQGDLVITLEGLTLIS